MLIAVIRQDKCKRLFAVPYDYLNFRAMRCIAVSLFNPVQASPTNKPFRVSGHERPGVPGWAQVLPPLLLALWVDKFLAPFEGLHIIKTVLVTHGDKCIVLFCGCI